MFIQIFSERNGKVIVIIRLLEYCTIGFLEIGKMCFKCFLCDHGNSKIILIYIRVWTRFEHIHIIWSEIKTADGKCCTVHINLVANCIIPIDHDFIFIGKIVAICDIGLVHFGIFFKNTKGLIPIFIVIILNVINLRIEFLFDFLRIIQIVQKNKFTRLYILSIHDSLNRVCNGTSNRKTRCDKQCNQHWQQNRPRKQWEIVFKCA